MVPVGVRVQDKGAVVDEALSYFFESQGLAVLVHYVRVEGRIDPDPFVPPGDKDHIAHIAVGVDTQAIFWQAGDIAGVVAEREQAFVQGDGESPAVEGAVVLTAYGDHA